MPPKRPPPRGGNKSKAKEKAVEEERPIRWGDEVDDYDNRLAEGEASGWGGFSALGNWNLESDNGAARPSSPPPALPPATAAHHSSRPGPRASKSQAEPAAPVSVPFNPSAPDNYPSFGSAFGVNGFGSHLVGSPPSAPKSPIIQGSGPANARNLNGFAAAPGSSSKLSKYDLQGNLPGVYPSGIANLPNVAFSTLSPLGNQRPADEPPPPTVPLAAWPGMTESAPEMPANKRGGYGITWGDTTIHSPKYDGKPPVINVGGWPGINEETAPEPVPKSRMGFLKGKQNAPKKRKGKMEQEEMRTEEQDFGWNGNAGDTWGGAGDDGGNDASNWNDNPSTNDWSAAAATSWSAPQPSKSTWNDPTRGGTGATAWEDSGQPQLDSFPEDSKRSKGKGKKKGKHTSQEAEPPVRSWGVSMSVDQEREREPEDRWSEINDEREVDHHLGQSWGEPGLKGYAGGSAWNDPTPARSSTIKSYSRGFGSTVPLDHDDRIQESGGKGLSDAHHAMYGSHRLAQDRFMWILPYQHDPRVVSMHNFIEQSSSALAKLGFHKYLNTREKGALFVNVDYTSEEAPTEPAFDWLKFPDLQRTRDRTLQQSVAANNPAKTCLVFMFLVSKSGNSVGMWRRKIPVPQSLQTAYQDRVRRLESEVRDKVYVVKIDPTLSYEARALLNSGKLSAASPQAANFAEATASLKEKKPGKLARLVRWITWSSGGESKSRKKQR